MKSHTAKERKLKTDITQKNALRRNLEKRLSAINRWTGELSKTRNLQRRKKLEASIARYQDQVEHLKKELLNKDEDLEKRIKEERTYSEEEIKAFQSQLDRDIKAFQKTQKKLEETKKSEGKTEGTPATKGRLEKLLKQESARVKKDEKELKAEEKDKVLFTLELKRIALEQKLYTL